MGNYCLHCFSALREALKYLKINKIFGKQHIVYYCLHCLPRHNLLKINKMTSKQDII